MCSGICTWITSAPQSASWRAAVGPARTCVMSTTRKRARAWEAGMWGMVFLQELGANEKGRPLARTPSKTNGRRSGAGGGALDADLGAQVARLGLGLHLERERAIVLRVRRGRIRRVQRRVGASRGRHRAGEHA